MTDFKKPLTYVIIESDKNYGQQIFRKSVKYSKY